MRLGYGTYVRSQSDLASKVREEIQLADAAGFDAIFFTEHHGMEGFVPNPLAAATFALGVSPRLRAGTLPLLLPLHDPVRIGEEAVLAEAFSGGRLLLGIGAGYLPRDFEQAGIALTSRAARTDEGLRILRAVCAGGPVHVDGRHYQVDIDPVVPASAGTVTPIWYATGSRTGVRRAARLADGLVIDALRPIDDVAVLVHQYRAACLEAGRPRGEVVVNRRVWLGDDREVADFVRAYRQELEGYSATVGTTTSAWLDDLRRSGITDEAVRSRIIAGSPAECAEQLAAHAKEIGIDYIVAKFELKRSAAGLRDQLVRCRELCALVADRSEA